MREIKIGKLTFRMYEVGTCAVVDCEKDAVEVVIPGSVEDVPVIGIQESAFENCTRLKSIQFPPFDVTQWLANASHVFGILGKNAFRGCTSLEHVTLPSDIQVIPYGAFAGCTSLKILDRSKGLYCLDLDVQDCAFEGCVALESVPPVAFSRIHSFEGCTSLKHIDYT